MSRFLTRLVGRRGSLLVWALLAASASAHAQSTPAPLPPTPVAFEEALLTAANTLFSKANLNRAGNRVPLVIDPLIDGSTAAQSMATRSMEQRIADLVRTNYRRYEVTPFTTAALANSPVVLIGTFTAINNAGDPSGPRDVYRICLALADLKAKRIISKGATRARPDGIDATPIAFFADSPAFVKDSATEAYIKSCQSTRPGDPIDQIYIDRIQVALRINDAIEAYSAEKYAEAMMHFEEARRIPGGEQLRVLNGLYLANSKLNRRDAAREAFGRIVDYGLAAQQLSVKFLFGPNSARFGANRALAQEYATWVGEIARRTSQAAKCLEVIGHTSASGPTDVNEKLSLRRAQYVMGLLQATLPRTRPARFVAKGVGSRELMVGTGKDDASDALDRRVEFKPIACPVPVAASDDSGKIERAVRPAKASGRNRLTSKRETDDDELSGLGIPRALHPEVRRYLNSSGIGQLLDE
jgi:outer membrane protein OmpA-like peptidoglycan-associated protein